MAEQLTLRTELVLEGVELPVHIGASAEERAARQVVTFNIAIIYDGARAAKDDDLNSAIDYVRIFDLLKRITEERSWNLLEAMCFDVIGEMFKQEPRLSEVVIECRKTIMPSVRASLCRISLDRTDWINFPTAG